ncbi:MAG: polysaccharide deacetylase family protein [Planctomycetota bacterium]
MAGIKHRLKVAAREAFARVVWHSGLHRLFDRLSGPRCLVLYGHCVADDELNGALHPDMKIEAEHLGSILAALGKRYDLVTVAEGAARIRSGRGRSCVALSMDDGYRDNLLRLVPLLERHGARATVFLEAGAVAERRLPWLHALGWLEAQHGAAHLSNRLAELVPEHRAALETCTDGNRLKRILKYDADPSERDRALDELLDEACADRRAIVDALYLSEDEARALAAAGPVELGGHTVAHPVLARLDEDAQRAEIAGGRNALAGVVGDVAGATFAYPYGRPWDWDAASKRAVESAGYASAVTTIAGVNTVSTDPYALRRWPIHAGSRLHVLGTEASGAFEWLRRLGVELVQS